MTEVNDRIEEIVEFLRDGEGYDKNEVIVDILGEIKGLNDYHADEITLDWDSEELMILSDFVDEFYNKLTEKFCNAISSFKDR
ncbi:hypothetical protein ACDX78_13560 [Virgibacillus oceani]